jgi:hypothetical protein
MVDWPYPGAPERPSRWFTDWTRLGVKLLRARWRFLLGLLFALGLSAAMADTIADYRQKKCDAPIGKLAVKLRLDQYYSGCKCMKPALDFRDPCNSMYLGFM